mmetsp:Transcript_9730/g.23815  ORF Transcript_9730/g.23815 Transcript_9730/m.23815 type:complete len:205 (+) Transcript_9730:1258-1872(+)
MSIKADLIMRPASVLDTLFCALVFASSATSDRRAICDSTPWMTVMKRSTCEARPFSRRTLSMLSRRCCIIDPEIPTDIIVPSAATESAHAALKSESDMTRFLVECARALREVRICSIALTTVDFLSLKKPGWKSRRVVRIVTSQSWLAPARSLFTGSFPSLRLVTSSIFARSSPPLVASSVHSPPVASCHLKRKLATRTAGHTS